jgi:amino acid transporter
MIGIIVAVVAALTPIDILGEMVSIGALFAFVLVCSAVVYLRRSDVEVARPFRVPNVPWVPLVGIVFCLLLMARAAARDLDAPHHLVGHRARRAFRLWQPPLQTASCLSTVARNSAGENNRRRHHHGAKTSST